MRLPRTRTLVATTVVATGILVASASSAFAAHTLSLSAPSGLVVGTPAFVTATGTIPQDEIEFPYWFSLDAIPTSVTTICPQDQFEGKQIATSTGGAVIVFTQREVADANGNFSIPVGVTPNAAGSVLLCGYTDDGATNTLAAASLIVTIGDRPTAAPAPAAAPRGIPAQTRAAVRSCKALLSGRALRSCVSDVVAKGKARCRRLHPRSRGAACVRAVTRIGR